MSGDPQRTGAQDDESIVRHNTAVTLIGTAGKVAAPLYLAFATRLYGVEAFGIFATAQVLCEMAMSFLTAGFNDAALMHAEDEGSELRAASSDHEEPVALPASTSASTTTEIGHQALATAFFAVFVLSIFVLFPAALAAPWLLRPFFSYAEELGAFLQWMAVGLPFFGLSRMMVATTIGRQDMRYDAAVNGFTRPFGLLLFALLFYFADGSATGLAMGWTCAQITAFVVSWHGFARYVRLVDVWRAFRHHGVDRRVVRFAIPQSLSVTFQRFAAGMDILMLGALGMDASVTGVYAIAVQIVENAVNTMRFVFVNVFNPWVPQYFRRGQTASLMQMMTVLSVRSVIACTAVAIATLCFEAQVMGIFVASYTPMPLTFSLLIAAPWLLGAFGLAGSVIVLSGHSRLNLFNALSVAGINALLNLLFIPLWGATGAAAGTLIGIASLVALQNIQAARISGEAPRWSALFPTALICLSLLACFTFVFYRYELGLMARVPMFITAGLVLLSLWYRAQNLVLLDPSASVHFLRRV